VRNAYALYDYGDFESDPSSDPNAETSFPFVQLLSITEADKAFEDFVKVRGTPSGSDGGNNDISDATKKKAKKIARTTVYIIAACAVGGLLLTILAIWAICIFCRRNIRKDSLGKLKSAELYASQSGDGYRALNLATPLKHE
jgi:hypothetical protein